MTITIEQTLMLDEGLRLMPYKCTAGKITIGVGRNIEDRGISKDEAELMLKNDIRIVTKELLNDPDIGRIYQKQSPARQLALKNMAFNLGTPTLKKFRNMWAALEAGDYDKAADEAMDSRWYRQVKSRGDRIVSVIRNNSLDSYAEVL